MSYTVLARRYRSTTFEDIVGQEPIARTLQNAIQADRTAHAYLFSGTRGVGKTSMARIFARELNMSEELQEIEAIGKAILRGEDLDVIEIDGASNRGVQEARDLIAASGLSPTRCRYRIYIIDEVHMLTTPAFNALLKTMEEPPSHVKFILCTTEPHKVPATIQSRCQRFDFRTIPTAKIATHLSSVLQMEGVTADDEVIAEVARLGNGSMRDALSILDRLLAGGAKTIAIDEMEELLGLPSQSAVRALCEAIARSDMKAAFEAADSLIVSGITLDRVLEVIATALRHALVARVCGKDSTMLELSNESRSQAETTGQQFDEATITHMIALCDATSRQVRRGGTGRAIFDATIARLCLTSEIVQAGGVLAKDRASTPSVKKKRLNSPSVSQVVHDKQQTIEVAPSQLKVQSDANVPPSTTKRVTLTSENILQVIASTPGLKKIATHLIFDSLQDNRVIFSIAKEGMDASKYIIGQRSRIEDVISNYSARRITVQIKAHDEPIATKGKPLEIEAVESDELVQAARGLFEGTVVRVTKTNKEQP